MTRQLGRLPGALVLLTLSGLLSACLGGTPPPTHYYVLHTPPAPSAGTPGGLSVGVAILEVDPPYDQGRLVYRPRPGSSEIGFYNYHRWAAPLGRLMASALAAGLTDAPGVASAEPMVAGPDYDALLFGRVIYIEEVDHPDRSEARVALALTLQDAEGESLWKGTTEGSASGPGRGGAEVMELMRSAFGEAVERLRREIGDTLTATP